MILEVVIILIERLFGSLPVKDRVMVLEALLLFAGCSNGICIISKFAFFTFSSLFLIFLFLLGNTLPLYMK